MYKLYRFNRKNEYKYKKGLGLIEWNYFADQYDLIIQPRKYL